VYSDINKISAAEEAYKKACDDLAKLNMNMRTYLKRSWHWKRKQGRSHLFFPLISNARLY
jgi:hypothetical protein